MIKKALSAMLRRTGAGSRLLTVRTLDRAGYLKDKGWVDSVLASMPIDAVGEPVPWYTYSAIDFLAGRVNSGMRVFEYGSGNSTLWWSRKARHVVSCEHDRAWYDVMRPRVPANVEYLFADLTAGDDYVASASRQAEPFDVIVIDGRDRVNCARSALSALTADGVIVWDNSDRTEYDAGYRFLLDHGFRRLDFGGMGPINAYGWCTSLFYRPLNCFDV